MGKSGRGGARERGGRPSPWKNGPTKTIRIPEVFAEAVLDVVKNLTAVAEKSLLSILNPCLLTSRSKRIKLLQHSPANMSTLGTKFYE